VGICQEPRTRGGQGGCAPGRASLRTAWDRASQSQRRNTTYKRAFGRASKLVCADAQGWSDVAHTGSPVLGECRKACQGGASVCGTKSVKLSLHCASTTDDDPGKCRSMATQVKIELRSAARLSCSHHTFICLLSDRLGLACAAAALKRCLAMRRSTQPVSRAMQAARRGPRSVLEAVQLHKVVVDDAV
jgi:hypothetical protein